MGGRGIKRTNVKLDVCACLFGHPLTFCFDCHCSSYRSSGQLSLTLILLSEFSTIHHGIHHVEFKLMHLVYSIMRNYWFDKWNTEVDCMRLC